MRALSDNSGNLELVVNCVELKLPAATLVTAGKAKWKHTFMRGFQVYGAASAAHKPTFLDLELPQLTDPSVCDLVTSTV